MKKILLIIFIYLFLIGTYSCNKNNGNEVQNGDDILPPTKIDTSKKTVVTFYHAMGQSNSIIGVLNDITDDYEKEILTKYGAKVNVEFKNFGNYDNLENEISKGEHPTIAQTKPDHVASYLKDGAVSPLNYYIEHNEYGLEGDKEDSYGYFDSFFNEGSIYDNKGTIYSIPFNKSTEVLYYNKDLFDKYNWEAPKTWDDVIEICEAWKKTFEYQAMKDAGKKVGGIGINSEANFFITLIKQWGSEYTGFNEDGVGEYRFDNDKTRAALSWLVDEFNKGNIVTATYLDTDYCSDAFIAQQIPMTIGSSAGASFNITNDVSFVTGVSPYPQVAGATEDEKFVIQQGTNITLFECADKQEELFGWLFMKYLTNYESSLEWALRTAYFPIHKDVATSKEYQEFISQIIYDENGQLVKEYDAVKETCVVGLNQIDYFYTVPTFFDTSSANSKCKFIIDAILYNQKEYDIDKAIKEAIDALSKSS